jgi:hypothetical protein
VKQSSKIKKYIFYSILTAIVVSMVLLVISIAKSAYFYQYDSDEFYHVQRAYLIASGFKPYTSFFFIFSTIFHRTIAPILLLFGYSFYAIGKIRIFMIVLFFVRVILTVFLINKIFNRRVALLFVPLFLFDPFTVFTSMQIRPDNFMMTVYTLGLLIFVIGFLNSSKLRLFVSGLVLGISCLTLLKIAPQIIAIFFIYGFYCLTHRNINSLILLIDGFISAIFLFVTYHLINQTFIPMIKQIFVISLSLSKLITNPVYYGFFHEPNNGFIYGLMGKPATWVYVWVLPLMAAVGAYITLNKNNNDKQTSLKIQNEKRKYVQMILIVSLIVQFIILLNLSMAFIQYYIPFQWLLAIFAAVMIDDLAFSKFTSKVISYLVKSGLLIFFFVLIYVSIKANNARAEFNSDSQQSQFAQVWSKIPPNKAVFPSILFRPIVHPVTEGFGNQEDYSRYYSNADNSFPSYIDSFEKYKVPYLEISDPTRFYALEGGMEKYVNLHFQKTEGQLNIYRRVK